MRARYWSGLILLYNQKANHQIIFDDHRLLFPLHVPVFIPPHHAYNHVVIGEASSFIQDQHGVRATVSYDDSLIPLPLKNVRLYPAVELAETDSEYDSESGVFVVKRGRLRSVALTEFPAWPNISPVIR